MPFSQGAEISKLPLKDNTVHVWQVPLVLPSSKLKSLYLILSPDEQARCDNLRLEALKTRFIASHGVLRKILGRYLQTDPGKLVFSGETSGKPHLADMASRINFNMSHSGDLSILAVSLGRSVGIDLERIRAVNNLTSLTRRYFTPSEHSHIISLADGDREKAFFTAWVLKEAYLKATGTGLAGLANLELIHTASGLNPTPLIIKNSSVQSSQAWAALLFEPSPSYIAAVVAEGKHFNPCYYFESCS